MLYDSAECGRTPMDSEPVLWPDELVVQLDDCRKQVSAKTLQHSHGSNCVVKIQKQRQPTMSREDGNHSLGTEVTKEQKCQS